MIRCAASTATRVASPPSVSRSCVTMTTVKPSSCCSMRMSWTKLSARSGSSPAVGSSSTSSSGSSDSARASATRLIMPPDSSAGIRRACRGSSSTRLSFNMTRSRIIASSRIRSSRSGNAMLSKTENAENSAPCWKSMPKRRRTERRMAGSGSSTGCPNRRTVPLVGTRSPTISRSSVVLPLPDPPTMPRISPALTSRSIPRCTTVSPKRVCTPRTSMTGALIRRASRYCASGSRTRRRR